MSLSVAGKYAIITGGGSGINLAFARLLLTRGCSVLIGDLSLRPEAKELLSEFPHPSPDGKRPSALFHPTNVTSWPQLSALFDKGVSSFPQVDIICPGAGLFEPLFSNFWYPPKTATNPDTPSRDAVDHEPGTYAVLDVNLTHPIRLSQLGIGYWTKNKMPGCLVHVSSIAGHVAGIGTPLYYASKHGLHGFVRSLGSLRDELGIRVSAIAPGSVKTPMWSDDPHKAAMSSGGTAVPMTPEDIAEGMLELCENPQYGDGTILEATIGLRRVVPLFGSEPPTGAGIAMPGYMKMQEELVQTLKDKGLST